MHNGLGSERRPRGAKNRALTGAASLLMVAAVACSSGSSTAPATSAPASGAQAAASAAPAAPAQAAAAKPAAASPVASPSAQAGSTGAPVAAASGDKSLAQLYEEAKAEGGPIMCYCTLSSSDKILPVFEKTYPGLKVQQVDGTQDQLVARAVAEKRGGRVIADVYQGGVVTLPTYKAADLPEEWIPPEAANYPDNLKGSYWVAADAIYIVPAINTNLVTDAEAPKGFEDLADPKWKGKIIGEPRDVELLMGLALYKYKDDQKAADLLKKIAANQPEWHNGHSDLTQFLVGGQASVCFTCYAHQMVQQVAKGAPVKSILDEGTFQGTTISVLKGAPHPSGAKLFARWLVSDEGQKAEAAAGRLPVRPGVEVPPNSVPHTQWVIRPEDYEQYDKYQKMWNDIFGLR